MKAKIKERKNTEGRRKKEDQAVEKAVANATMEIPDAMIDTEVRQMANDFSQRIMQQGLTVEQYFQFTGMTEEKMMEELRETLGDIPLLFTFRTLKEGGEKEIEKSVYVKLNEMAVKTGFADLVDAEAFTGTDEVNTIVETAHLYGVKVIASNHDFQKTPPKEEIVSRLCFMQECGADIVKIAVMPRSKKDVLTLLLATEEMVREHAQCPVVTMSMSEVGVVSRICGEAFGSALTFGAVKKASAPGQLGAEELRMVLKILHDV